MPDFLLQILASMGVPGAIIFVLLGAIGGLVSVIRSMQKRADKIYGYRLAERDTLNTAMNATAKVLGDMLEATEDRNELTEAQADLLAKQSAAFELLKVTIVAQYENAKDNHHVTAQTITAMAEAVRVLTAMVQDNRHFMSEKIAASTKEIVEAIRTSCKGGEHLRH